MGQSSSFYCAVIFFYLTFVLPFTTKWYQRSPASQKLTHKHLPTCCGDQNVWTSAAVQHTHRLTVHIIHTQRPNHSVTRGQTSFHTHLILSLHILSNTHRCTIFTLRITRCERDLRLWTQVLTWTWLLKTWLDLRLKTKKQSSVFSFVTSCNNTECVWQQQPGLIFNNKLHALMWHCLSHVKNYNPPSFECWNYHLF